MRRQRSGPVVLCVCVVQDPKFVSKGFSQTSCKNSQGQFTPQHMFNCSQGADQATKDLQSPEYSSHAPSHSTSCAWRGSHIASTPHSTSAGVSHMLKESPVALSTRAAGMGCVHSGGDKDLAHSVPLFSANPLAL